VYLCFCVFIEFLAALVVGGTLHHQTLLPDSIVCLVPLDRAPPLQHLVPALKMCGAPIMNHLPKKQVHDISEDKIKHI
jgi:hypothetical protein